MNWVVGACSVIGLNVFSLAAWYQQFSQKKESVGWDSGMGGRAKGDNRKVEGTQDQAPHEFISPLACVRGTSSEPIKVVTR